MGLILHLPHATPYIPLAERADLAVEDDELARQSLALVDDRADDLFAPINEHIWLARAKVSPLVVDVLRHRDDAEEPAAELGLGAVHTRGVGNVPLRPSLDAGRRERLLRDWYDPHHERLGLMVRRQRESGETKCVLLDLLTYPEDPLPTEFTASARPEICVSTDPEWSRGIERVVRDHFVGSGYTVAENQPFAGATVPALIRENPQRNLAWISSFHQQMAPCKGFYSVRVHVRRDVYLGRGTHLPGPRYNHLKFTLNTLYSRLSRTNFWIANAR